MSAEHAFAATEPLVLSTRDAGVATITLNRGERFNPLSSGMIAALHAELGDGWPPIRTFASSILAAAGRGILAPATTSRRCAPTPPTHAWQRPSVRRLQPADDAR